MAVSCTFCHCAWILQETKETTGLASIKSISDTTIAKYAQFLADINLQKIAEMMKESWTLAVALD
eukprot:7657715-Ditylum_brightwellii.AAC.1